MKKVLAVVVAVVAMVGCGGGDAGAGAAETAPANAQTNWLAAGAIVVPCKCCGPGSTFNDGCYTVAADGLGANLRCLSGRDAPRACDAVTCASGETAVEWTCAEPAP